MAENYYTEEAEEKGYDLGYGHGYDAGYQEGYDLGYVDGYDAAMAEIEAAGQEHTEYVREAVEEAEDDE